MTGFKVGAMLLHTIAAGVLTYGWLELGKVPNNAFVVKQKGGHFQFLTIQGYAHCILVCNREVLMHGLSTLD